MKTIGSSPISLVRKLSPRDEWVSYVRGQDAWLKSFDSVISFGVFIQGFSVAVNRWRLDVPFPSVERDEAKIVDIGEPHDLNYQSLQLRLKDLSKLSPPVGRYLLFKQASAAMNYTRSLLELLGDSTKKLFIIGIGSDPLAHLSAKEERLTRLLGEIGVLENSITLLKTRSPRMVSFAEHVERLKRSNTIRFVVPIETTDDAVIRRYTPHDPLISERIFAAQVLRRGGFQVGIQVAPLLPYGSAGGGTQSGARIRSNLNHNRDTENFAEILAANSDFVELAPLTPSDFRDLKRIRATSLVKRLESDMKYAWLRQDSVYPLLTELRSISPQLLACPEPGPVNQKKQLSLFAA
jgi:hypothetical protein